MTTLVLVVAAQVVAFGAAVQRWAVGGAGTANPVRFLFDPRWSPPVPSALLLLLFLGGMAGVAAVAVESLRYEPPVAASPVPPAEERPVAPAPVS